MILLLALHALAATACLAPGPRAGRWAFPVALAAPAGTFLWLCVQAPSVLGGTAVEQSLRWVPQLGLTLSFRLDGFGLLMGLLVSGIGVLVLGYCLPYFAPHDGHPARADLGRIAGLLVAFAGAMLGLVLSDGFFTLFLFWELTSITSYLLIGIDDRSAEARTAAQRAFLVTGAGGLALLAGLVLLGQQSGTTSLSALVTDPPGGTVTTVALVLVLAGAFAKSAQVPFNFWLPGAMAAPTPVSAYLHSATMVKAGIVLVARLAPAFADQAPWRVLVVACGGASLLVGGVQALRQQDAKLALAQGTVSQLGLIMVLVGMGTPALTYAGVAVLTAHALFKAALFLVVGVVDHQAGTRDMRRLRHLGRRLPVLGVLAATAAASMAAIPPTFGFVAKESGLAALLDPGVGAVGAAALVLVVTGSVLTVAYSVRTVDGLFGRGTSGTTGGAAAGGEEPVGPDMVPRPGAAFMAAPAVLALLSLLCGLAAGAVGAFLAEVASSLDPASADGHLTLWPGIGAALGLSAATWVLGAVVATAVHRHEAGRDATTGIGARGLRRPLRRADGGGTTHHRGHPERLAHGLPGRGAGRRGGRGRRRLTGRAVRPGPDPPRRLPTGGGRGGTDHRAGHGCAARPPPVQRRAAAGRVGLRARRPVPPARRPRPGHHPVPGRDPHHRHVPPRPGPPARPVPGRAHLGPPPRAGRAVGGRRRGRDGRSPWPPPVHGPPPRSATSCCGGRRRKRAAATWST